MTAEKKIDVNGWDHYVEALQRFAAASDVAEDARAKIRREHRAEVSASARLIEESKGEFKSLRGSLDRATLSLDAVYSLFDEKRPNLKVPDEVVTLRKSDAKLLESELKQLETWADNASAQGRALARALRRAENDEREAELRAESERVTQQKAVIAPPPPPVPQLAAEKRDGISVHAVLFAVVVISLIVAVVVLLL